MGKTFAPENALTEGSCETLLGAGNLAREKGLLGKNDRLTCPFVDCDGSVCLREQNPDVRTVYIQSAPLNVVSQTDRFYKKVEVAVGQ